MITEKSNWDDYQGYWMGAEDIDNAFDFIWVEGFTGKFFTQSITIANLRVPGILNFASVNNQAISLYYYIQLNSRVRKT